jgi:hypothetical protein
MVSRRDAEANRQKVKEHGLTFPVVLQKQWEISLRYGIFATPVGYLIDERTSIDRNAHSSSATWYGSSATQRKREAE